MGSICSLVTVITLLPGPQPEATTTYRSSYDYGSYSGSQLLVTATVSLLSQPARTTAPALILGAGGAGASPDRLPPANPLIRPPRVRRIFPETWLWLDEDSGYAGLIFNLFSFKLNFSVKFFRVHSPFSIYTFLL